MEDDPQVSGNLTCTLLQLAPGDADDPPAGRGQAPVAGAVALEGGAGVVEGAPVELGDQPLTAPEAVAFEPLTLDLKPCVELGPGERGFGDEGAKAGLELAARELGALSSNSLIAGVPSRPG